MFSVIHGWFIRCFSNEIHTLTLIRTKLIVDRDKQMNSVIDRVWHIALPTGPIPLLLFKSDIPEAKFPFPFWVWLLGILGFVWDLASGLSICIKVKTIVLFSTRLEAPYRVSLPFILKIHWRWSSKQPGVWQKVLRQYRMSKCNMSLH